MYDYLWLAHKCKERGFKRQVLILARNRWRQIKEESGFVACEKK